jgi:hypothetical protein
MRATSTTLLNALATPGVRLTKADLFTIILADGTIYRWTDFDQDVVYNPVTTLTWLAQGPLLQRSRLGVKNTVEVPELIIQLAALDTDFIGGLAIKTQIHNGYFDGAQIALDRVFLVGGAWYAVGAATNGESLVPPYCGNLFSGRMSEAKITATGVEITAKGANVLMNQYVPRNLYQLPCIHTFCDQGCTLSATSFTLSTTAGAGSTRSLVAWGTVPANPALYTLGVLTVTSGAAIGQIRTVKLGSAAGLLLQYPLYNAPASGDTMSVLKGCSKAYDDGTGQSCTDYANTQHYRGYPFTPPAEEAF